MPKGQKSDYSKALIYKISCRDPSITDCYVGSTTNLIQRRNGHKNACCNSKDLKHHVPVYQFIRDNGGWDNWQVVPVELYPCASRPELDIRENYWLNELGATLNKNTPAAHTLAGGAIEYQKQYYAANADEIKEKRKQHYIANADKISEKQKQYYTANADKIIERQKQYYAANADKIKEKKTQKETCECGSVVSHHYMKEHQRTLKHQRWAAAASAVPELTACPPAPTRTGLAS